VVLAVVERILEKHSSDALELIKKRLNISALQPVPDALPSSAHEMDAHCLLFTNLPDSVSTDSFKEYLQRASSCQDRSSRIGRQSAVSSVIYAARRGTAMAVFKQSYGNNICASYQGRNFVSKSGLYLQFSLHPPLKFLGPKLTNI